MDPALALPSYQVYRGSLLALLVGSIVAVWLLVLPPASADQDGPPDSIAGLVATRTATPTPEATTGVGEATAEATPDAQPEETNTPEPTPTEEPPPEEETYVVQGGDTMLLIAEQFAPPGVDPTVFADSIAAANGITDPSALQVGQELTIPNE